MSTNAVSVLRQQWNRSGERLERRLAGLTDAEFFWEPCRPCWTVKPDLAAPSGWTYDYEEPQPNPPPVTTIAWRLVHIAADNWIYWEWAFGPGERVFPDLLVPSSLQPRSPTGATAGRPLLPGWSRLRIATSTNTDRATSAAR